MPALLPRGAGDNPGVYTTSASLWSLENTLSTSYDSDIHEDLARHGWSLHVGLLALPTLPRTSCDPNHSPIPIWQLGDRHQP